MSVSIPLTLLTTIGQCAHRDLSDNQKIANMKKTESIEKDALTEMMSPSVSPSAASDAEVKKSVEMALQDFTPKNRIADSVIDEEAVAETQSIAKAKAVNEDQPTIQRRVSSKQRKLSLEEYRNAYLKVLTIIDRKPVFVSCEVRDKLEDYVRKLVGRKMSVSGLLENIARQHLDTSNPTIIAIFATELENE